MALDQEAHLGGSAGGVEGWGEKAHNCNWITIKKLKLKKDFLLVFNLCHFNYHVFWCGPVWVYIVETICAFWTVSFPLPGYGSFQSLFLQISSQSLAVSLPLVLIWHECCYAWCCPRGSLNYPHFKKFFFFLLLWMNVFCCLIFWIADSILCFI